MKIRAWCVVLFIFTFTAGFLNAEDRRRDGNWWNEGDRQLKLSYILGFFDGMDLGAGFSFWKFIDDPCAARAKDSYKEYSAKYSENVTNGQLVDGLDEFYKDYKNRKTILSQSVWIVLKSIAGTPKDELEKLIENKRRNPG
jgi:hypothetical protein